MPRSRCSLANSTIRMPFLAAIAISTTRPICGVEVERQMEDQDAEERAQDADRDRQQHRDRDHPALVKADQEQEGEQHREAQDRPGLARSRDFLVRGSGPFVAIAGGNVLPETSAIAASAAPGRGPRRRAALDRDRAVIVVAGDDLRADDDARHRRSSAAAPSVPDLLRI